VHAGEVITVICELSLANAGEKIMTNAIVIRITAMQYRTASILIFLDGCIIVTNDDFKDDSKRRSGLGLFISIDADQRISPYVSDLILPGTKGLIRWIIGSWQPGLLVPIHRKFTRFSIGRTILSS
jgi:hypothetical protein